ncbi:hypothetical protein [Parafrankia sp. FMc2]|uniref:hypothetical protein n=1 Tax=Parafrankia sp. FMc2 TaxID=3233196 RepID=UPI0034D4127A
MGNLEFAGLACPQDIVVFGAPGSTYDDEGRLQISPDGVARADLAADYWWANSAESVEPIPVTCVAGRPAKRQGMQATVGQAEAYVIGRLLTDRGVPEELVRPNKAHPLGRDYATSTVDEVGILVENGLTPVDKYTPDSPLALVIHRRHGRRAVDIWRKIGFDSRQLQVISPKNPDPKLEIALRLGYRACVLGTGAMVSPDVLRRREERFYRMAGFVTRVLPV